MAPIVPCLWFDSEAEEAAKFYTSVFKGGKISNVARYGKEGKEIHGREEGSVLTVDFEIEGKRFVALNGGPVFKFNEAVSFQILVKTQEELDYYWNKLTEGGDRNAQQCGWLKDKFGVSWQVVPEMLSELMQDKDRKKADRVTKAMLQMKKLDIQALRDAAAGK